VGETCSTNEEKRTAYRLSVENARTKETNGKKYVGGLITLRWILWSYDGIIWTGLIWLRIE
jgi:hypothetical protein